MAAVRHNHTAVNAHMVGTPKPPSIFSSITPRALPAPDRRKELLEIATEVTE